MSATAPFLKCGGRASRAEFAAVCTGGTILEARQRTGAVKVIRIKEPGGTDLIIKAWHPRRWISSARIRPYDLRFRDNAARLRKLGFQAPCVRGWGSIGYDGTRFITYEALPGETLRTLAPNVDLAGAAAFIASLHDAGADFRSLHLGNILWEGGDRYGLIDLTDCRFSGRALSLKRRAARLIYLCTHKRDIAFMAADGRWTTFLRAYCEAAGADPSEMCRHARQQPGWSTLAGASQ